MTGAHWTSALWFIAILALIPLALWLLKRSPMGGAATGGAGLRSVASLALSASQRIVTVEVGHGDDRRWLVLGVTPNSINTLYSVAPFDDAAPAGPAAPGFVQMLGRLRGVAGGVANGTANRNANPNGVAMGSRPHSG